MLNVILTILKIIGIILLIILGIILFLVLSILFVPIRYKGTIEFDKADVKLNIKVSYFLKLMRFKLSFIDKMLEYKLKILFFTIFPKGEKESNKKKAKSNNKAKKVSEIEKEDDLFDDVVDVDDEKNISEESKLIQPNVLEIDSNSPELNESEDVLLNDATITSNENAENIKEKKSFLKKIKAIIQKIKDIFEKIKDFIFNFNSKITSICDKLKQISDKKTRIIDYLHEDKSKEALNVLKIQIFKLLKHIAPRKVRGSLEIGFNDPATTGQVYGLLCVFYGVYGDNIKITPDFENEIMKGNLYVRGRIRVFNLLIIGIKLYRQKRLREMLSYVKK